MNVHLIFKKHFVSSNHNKFNASFHSDFSINQNGGNL